jgi:hypothetical protein
VLVAQTVVPKSEDHSYINGYCSCGVMMISENLILPASKGLVFEAIADGYSLAGIGTCTDDFLIIPAMYNGKPVVEISASALVGIKTFKKVFIPSTVSKIGSMAFSNCYAMAEVIFAENSRLSTISAHAFYNSGLVSIVLPEGLNTLEDAAFHSCKNLKEITNNSNLSGDEIITITQQLTENPDSKEEIYYKYGIDTSSSENNNGEYKSNDEYYESSILNENEQFENKELTFLIPP